MDPTSVGFVTLMVVLAGALCYTGDLLGRKLGKKRLTLLGLRPKHTAALFTALFGGLSTLIIILILGAVSADVRTWIIEGNRARAELADTRKQFQELTVQRDDLTSENTRLTGERDQTATELKSQKALLVRAETDVRQLTQQTRQLKSQAELFKGQISKVRADMAKVQKEYTAATTDLSDVKVNRDELVKQNSELSTNNLDLLQSNTNLEKRLQELNANILELQNQKEGLQKSLEDAQKRFESEIGKQSEELNRIKGSLDEARDNLNDVQEELNARQLDLDRVTGQLNLAANDIRLAPLRINRGDELARVPIGARLNLAESRRALVLAVSLASDEAERRGAASVPGTDNFATFIDLPSNPPLKGEEQMARAISGLMDQERPKLLIIRALVNTFETEFVPVAVDIVDNPVVYTKDQLVDQFEVDGSKREQEIADAIVERASTIIRDKALKAGIIPSIGRPQAIGELSRETVLNLVQSIKSAGRRVQVRLFASEETRAGDVLRLTYKIR